MSHISGHRKYDDNECCGPRPPVPGEESRVRKVCIDCVLSVFGDDKQLTTTQFFFR